MVRNVSLFLSLFCLTSCFYKRTSYGHIRLNPLQFSIKPNSNNYVYKVIDTTKLYELVDAVSIKYNQRPSSLKKEFLKFYANGRVGEFEVYYESDIKSLDPKKAKMAYYNYDGKNLVIQIYFEHPQGGGLITNKLLKVDNNFLELISDEYIDKYKIIDLKKEFLIYKPDW